jgi:hypothetical protein
MPMFWNTVSVPSSFHLRRGVGTKWNRQCSETLAFKLQTADNNNNNNNSNNNNTAESVQHSEHGESFKSRISKYLLHHRNASISKFCEKHTLCYMAFYLSAKCVYIALCSDQQSIEQSCTCEADGCFLCILWNLNIRY